MTPRVLLYCVLGGFAFMLPAVGDGHVALWWLSGALLAAAFVPVALYGPKGALAQFAVIAPVLWATSVFCTWSEAMVFEPRFRQNAAANLAGATVMFLIAAIVFAVLATTLDLHRQSESAITRRLPLPAVAMVAASGLAFAVYYLIFGWITFQYFTHGFYPDGIQQVERIGGWFWPMQIGRGILMTLSVLPIVYTLRLSRRQTALAVGAILWVAGGLAPLVVPNEFMGGTQRLIHIVEILTQNVPLGVTIVLLMRPGSQGQRLTAPIMAA